MGTDMHLHIEIKLNGRWEHYSTPKVKRNYRFFSLLADVRNDYGIAAISQPKGLPTDLTVVTSFDAKLWGNDGHSHSWLGAQELAVLDDDWEKLNAAEEYRLSFDIEHELLHCYFFENSFGGFHKFPQERPKGVEDLRWVFWFDN